MRGVTASAVDLRGKYRLGKCIARGGMGAVYRAQLVGAAGFTRDVVVKQILPHLLKDPEIRAMFIEEARLAARLEHPNIVQIFDFDEVEGALYIAMEYVRGADLAQLIRASAARAEHVPVEVVCFIVLELLEGLRYAHGLTDEEGKPAGLVHRDISPGNVLLSYEGAVKLADFGIAKAAGSMLETRAGVVKGKHAYMSPEQAAGDIVDPRTDIYAVGVILYEALTNMRPFPAKDAGLLRVAKERNDFRKPRGILPQLSTEIEAVVVRALNADRDKRFDSAEEMHRALVTALGAPPARELLRACLRRFTPEPARSRSEAPPPPPMPGGIAGAAPLEQTEVSDDDGVVAPAPSDSSPPDAATASDPPPGPTAIATSRASTRTTPLAEVSEIRAAAPPPHVATVPDSQPSSPSAPSGPQHSVASSPTAPASVPPSATSPSQQSAPFATPPPQSFPGSVAAQTTAAVGPASGSRSRWVAAVAIVALVGVVGAWIYASRRETPAVVPGAHDFTVIWRRSPEQEREVRAAGLDRALRDRGLHLRVRPYAGYEEVFGLLERGPGDLVSVPVATAEALVRDGHVVPVARVAGDRVNALRRLLTGPAAELASPPTAISTDLAYLPESVEVHVMAYRRSKVRFAVAHLESMRASLDAALRPLNGRGLPAGYALEPDPAQWDDYDVFVAGFIWAHADEDGARPGPRIGVRAQTYWPSVEELLENATRVGGAPELRYSRPMVDALTWLTLDREHELVPAAVWDRSGEARPSGGHLSDGLARGALYYARMNQYRVGELERMVSERDGRVDMADVAFAGLPQGVSLALDAAGVPVRRGSHDGLVNAWVYGIPARARDPALSLAVAERLIALDVQSRFARTGCAIPTRRGVSLDGVPRACRDAMAPAVERLDRPIVKAQSPTGPRLVDTLSAYGRLWDALFVERGYRAADGHVDVASIDAIAGRYLPD